LDWLFGWHRIPSAGVVIPCTANPTGQSAFPSRPNIELTDVQSERVLNARTSNLSLFGCYVSTTDPFPTGTKVSIRINHGGATLATFGQVVYFNPKAGIGIAFTEMEPGGQATLEKWIDSLRTK
jgi:hypothetical protein